MTEEELYEMELHSEKPLRKNLTVTRVTGGFIYHCYDHVSESWSPCFVPEAKDNPLTRKAAKEFHDRQSELVDARLKAMGDVHIEAAAERLCQR